MKRHLEQSLALLLLVVAALAAAAWITNSETPHGRVTGTLIAAESGSPLTHVHVSLARTDDSKYYSAETDGEGAFSFRSVETGSYRLNANTNAHRQNEQIVEVREGQVTDARWELKPVDPFLEFFQHQRVFAPSEAVKTEVRGFAPVAQLSISAYRIDQASAARAWTGRLNDILRVPGDLTKADLGRIPALSLTSQSSLPIRSRDSEGVFREHVNLGKLLPGMYVLAFGAAEVRAVGVITVTDLGAVLKSSPSETLVYAANIETGDPVPNARVEILQKDQTLATGTTGPDGTVSFNPKAGGNGRITVVVHHGESVAITGTYAEENRASENLRVFTYTDRPVYRPGHTVHFKAITRRLTGEEYTVPSGLKAAVRVVDRNQDIVFSGDLTMNKNGSLFGGFPLSRAAIPGPYTITINIDGASYDTDFMVAEYRKPEFQVNVKPDRKRFTVNETVEATVEANYYYGAGVPNAKVTWSVSRTPSVYRDDTGYWDEDLDVQSESDYAGGEEMDSGEGFTDSNGRIHIQIEPKPVAPEEDLGQDWQYTITASVTDASKFEAQGNGSAQVTQGDFRLEVRPDVFLGKPGVPMNVSIAAVDYDGKPVPNASGTVEFVRHTWKEMEQKSHLIASPTFQTDASGHAVVALTAPIDGDYGINAHAKDGHGNSITQPSWLYVMSSDSADFGYPSQSLEVHAAKRVFKEGETAEIVVQSPEAGVSALLTLENSKIVSKRVIRLEGKSNVIKIPITPECMPAANATVTYFRHKQYYNGSAIINVSRERKALKVAVTSDKAAYEPGESAIYHVKTLAPDGKPVSAEVSLGLVDEAVYAILEEQTPNIVSFFYPKRLYMVRTEYSFPDIYLSGDEKAGQGIRTRKLFPDTALWQPATMTDANGDATFRVTMPDSLTTWRATCRAADAETRVGQTTQTVVVQKPFLVRLEAPRFLTQGDEVEIAAVAHNLTKYDLYATIGLDSPLAPVNGQPRIERKVRAGQTERIAWRIRPTDIGGLRLRVYGTAGPANDAMELTVPVLAKGREQTDTRSGDVVGEKTENLQVRADCAPETQELTVRLSPSLLSAMLGSLDYLADYPYGCAEQTMSSFLPDVVLYRLLGERGISDQTLRAKVPPMVRDGLLKLYTFQHEDGGWKWWTYDSSDPWMTAYVMFGLHEAKDAGFVVNEGTYTRGTEALARIATNPAQRMGSDTRAYAAYVLSVLGRTDDARNAARTAISTANTRYIELSDWGRPWLALALERTGDSARAHSLLESVWAKLTDRGFRPSENQYEWRSNSEYGAALLYAACEISPHDPRLATMVRWLMDQRRANHWDSTRDTAAVLYALTRYAAITHELSADLDTEILVNGRSVASRHLSAKDMRRPEFSVTLGPKDLPIGPANVTVRARGTGRLYYTATLTQVTTLGLNAPLASDSGITIERRYRKVEPGERPEYARAIAAERQSTTEFRSGDIVEVTLVVHATRPFDYLMVEDPLPAGAEVRDRGAIDPSEWTFWWADQIVRDQKVGFAVRHIDPSSKHIIYRFTATVPGRYNALPPRVFDMYNPAVRGEGRADEVTIE